ncbi:MAG: cyclic nucleotide-binding domain-containing protein [Desulfobacterales bacterium]|nr:cyclic nucleotide-binding domain-containing protein [Desulfobacterales bacterium]
MDRNGATGEKITIADFIMDIPLFDALHGKELKIVADHMNFFEIEKKEILFREGDHGDYLCFVVEGELEVIKNYSSLEDAVVIAKASQKRSIGEMSVIDETTRSATVRASTKTTLIALPKSGFDSILEENPRIGIKILKAIARLMSMNIRRTSSRLADFMLME